jgi:2-polyprenyl-3-methyl-5-hydroxy-6-metoxy-1,4-benzoquinol methylase
MSVPGSLATTGAADVVVESLPTTSDPNATAVLLESLAATRDSQTLQVLVENLPSGKKKVTIAGTDANVPMRQWETSYPRWLIDRIVAAKGPAWVCDEIARDESPEYTAAALKWALLSYLGEDRFDGARILDFGCGAGASTVGLCKLFPTAQLVGIELEEHHLDVAKGRAEFYGFRNLEFMTSPSGVELPDGIGKFDHIVMSGVFEHLLPGERSALMPRLWTVLKPGGVLFLRETPNRYFPMETHTTGLPLLNYLPRWLVMALVQKFGRNNARLSWDELLRRGIRGGSIPEIRKLLPEATLLRPSRQGMDDLIDLWYASVPKRRSGRAKGYVRAAAKLVKALGFECPPYLELALQKNR